MHEEGTRRILVTGGAGFIGSALVRHLIRETPHTVLNVDALTYAGNRDSLAEVEGHERYRFAHTDIRRAKKLRQLLAEFRPSAVLHLAAESHVDRSIDTPADFVTTNVVGTFTLLEEATAYWRSLPAAERQQFRFLHISTDEVFGSLGATGAFSETTPYDPSSPYAASKAAADHFVRAWHRTYGLPVLITNCSNNYGPYQFPEKLIPLVILKALAGEPLPVYGRGENVRDWLYVEDHVRALLTVLAAGKPGETYAIGGRGERTNLEVVRHICRLLDELRPRQGGARYESLIAFVPDRPGHDLRYAIDPSKIERELGWKATVPFEVGLRRTVQWYLDNRRWCERVLSGAYRLERLGLAPLGVSV